MELFEKIFLPIWIGIYLYPFEMFFDLVDYNPEMRAGEILLFIGGMLAVVAALLVGDRQVDISAKHAEISERQSTIDIVPIISVSFKIVSMNDSGMPEKSSIQIKNSGKSPIYDLRLPDSGSRLGYLAPGQSIEYESIEGARYKFGEMGHQIIEYKDFDKKYLYTQTMLVEYGSSMLIRDQELNKEKID